MARVAELRDFNMFPPIGPPGASSTPHATSSQVIDLTVEEDGTSAARPMSASDHRQQRLGFLEGLQDVECWLSSDQRARVTTFIGRALLQWERWPHNVGLSISGQNEFGEEPQVLLCADLFRPRSIAVMYDRIKGVENCSVFVCHGGSMPLSLETSEATSAGSPEFRNFEGAPNGFFDAIAAGLDMCSRLEQVIGEVPTRQTPGQHLRQALAEWLRHGAGQRLDLPESIRWERSATPPVRLPSPPTPAPLAEPPLSLKIARLSSLPDVLPWDTTWQASDEAEARALISDLREGRWNAPLQALVCHALVRWRDNRLMSAGRAPMFMLKTGDTSCRYGFRASWTNWLGLISTAAAPAGFMVSRTMDSEDEIGPFSGENGFLTAYCALQCWPAVQPLDVAGVTRSVSGHVARIREQLSQILERDLLFVRVCTTVRRYWPAYPEPEVLLRQCLEGGALSWEGQQVMNPALADQTPKTWHDLQEVAALVTAPGQRRAALFEKGVPLIPVHTHVGPFGVIGAFTLKRHYRGGIPSSVALPVRAEYPWLRHVHGVHARVLAVLKVTEKVFSKIIAAAERSQFEKLTDAYALQSLIGEAPPAALEPPTTG